MLVRKLYSKLILIFIWLTHLYLFINCICSSITTISCKIYTSVYRAQFATYKRISLRIKASRCIITGCNSCLCICAYVSSSSKVPILRALFARRCVHPAFKQRAAAIANRDLISRSFIHVKTNYKTRVRPLPGTKKRISVPSRSIFSKDTLRNPCTRQKRGIMQSNRKTRISPFYCEYYATKNAIKEHALINKYPWKVSEYAYAIYFLTARHSFVTSVCVLFKGALRN